MGWQDWIGRCHTASERLDPRRAQALAATLGRAMPEDAAALPLLWHWIYFWDAAAINQLGPDGHTARGQFLPPVDLPHRMWAGGRLQCGQPLTLGCDAHRRATIANVEEKAGRQGPLVFVTVRYELWDTAGGELHEEQDIVYRGPRQGTGDEASAPQGQWRRPMTADPVLLFRYSALTFNGHRIHYDRDYATQQEGYPGLVVHGPLLATLLLDLASHEAGLSQPQRFDFRAQRPVFDGETFTLHADNSDRGRDLWVADHAGRRAMTAHAF